MGLKKRTHGQRHIFHITHFANLPSIVADGCLWSDRRLVDDEEHLVIGFDTIKQRRLEELPVHCHPETHVGDYVPFYFCPRSPMLYVIERRNAELVYKGGQNRVVHLVSTVDLAVQASAQRPWAFSDGNAGAVYTQFSNDLSSLATFVDWDAIHATQWSGAGVDPAVKNRKQAEFLVHDSFPWTSVRAIGVIRQSIADEVMEIMGDTADEPKVVVKPEWYY